MNSYIISAAEPEAAYRKALEMAADFTGKPEKVFSGNHPDVIVYRRTEGKTVFTVDRMREIVADSAILPNESPCKVYIIYDGEFMNTEAQNAALKILEEPPSYVVFILITSHVSSFLPTVRSRCAEITINSASAGSSEAESFALEVLRLLSAGDKTGLIKFCESSNKISNAVCRDYFSAINTVIADILCARRPNPGLSEEALFGISALADKCIRYLSANVGVKTVFGILESS